MPNVFERSELAGPFAVYPLVGNVGVSMRISIQSYFFVTCLQG